MGTDSDKERGKERGRGRIRKAKKQGRVKTSDEPVIRGRGMEDI